MWEHRNFNNIAEQILLVFKNKPSCFDKSKLPPLKRAVFIFIPLFLKGNEWWEKKGLGYF